MIQYSSKTSDRASKIAAESLARIGNHPFVRDAQEGLLTRDQIRRWLFCAGRESRIFPTVVKNMLTKGAKDNREIVAILAENLADELGNGNPEEAHFQHYLKLLRELKFSYEDFLAYEERAGIRLALSLALNISLQDSAALAIGYLLVNEGMTPITYAAVGQALRHEYQFADIPFLGVHVDIDAKHVAGLYRAVDQLDANDWTALTHGIGLGERGMMVLLDEAFGVFELVN